MSKTILSRVNGWTPVINSIVKEVNLMSAVVFGRIWRFCQMEDGVCRAALEKIAEEIGVDRATVMRHAKELCKAGYLKDLTPDLRNRPHVYADTGKASLEISITVAESNSTLQKVIPTVAESKLNKDSKKEIEYKPNRKAAKERKAKQQARRKDPVDFLLEHGSEIQMVTDMRVRVEAATGLGLSREWDKPRSTWNGYEKILIKREVETGQTIEQFMKWYNSDDFRKNGDIWLNADKIELWWDKAFEEQQEEPKPEIFRYDPKDDEQYVPPPETKPKILR